MALLFQSNPDKWDLRGHFEHFEQGKFVSWIVSRYQSLMYPGLLVLLWESKGAKPIAIKGLYGWGITSENVKPDATGRLRIRLQYIERWVSRADKNVPLADHTAPIPASQVLSLPAWKDNHLLDIMPIGTNFLVSEKQLEELSNSIIQVRFPKSQFQKAVELDIKGEQLDRKAFTPQCIDEA